MLPTTRAEAGSGVRRNGSTAAAWLGVNGTGSEPDQPGQVAHGPVEVAVGVLDRPHEVPEELEADRAVERAPGQQRADAHRLVDRRMVPAEDGDGRVTEQAGIALAGGVREQAGSGGIAE